MADHFEFRSSPVSDAPAGDGTTDNFFTVDIAEGIRGAHLDHLVITMQKVGGVEELYFTVELEDGAAKEDMHFTIELENAGVSEIL
jgi:hypothetical protein